MLVKFLVLRYAAVTADHFRAGSLSIVNGPTEGNMTIFRTLAWRRGSLDGFNGCTETMVQNQAEAAHGFEFCTIQSTGDSCGIVPQAEV